MSGFISGGNDSGGSGGLPSGAAGGNLSGTYPNPLVSRINNALVPSAGSLITGNLLQVSGIATLTYSPLNLAGGSNYVSGILPNSNLPDSSTSAKGIVQLAGDLAGTATSVTVTGLQTFDVNNTTPTDGYVLTWVDTDSYWAPRIVGSSPSGSAGGDLSGSYPNPTVSKVNGATIPAAGSLTTGNILQVSGVSTLSYGAVNLAGGNNYVTGLLPTGNQAAQSLAGDLSGTTASATVEKINGATVPLAGALVTSQVLQVSGTSALTYGLIVNTNIDSAAAIAGTKISPDFGSQSVSTTGTLVAAATTLNNATANSTALTVQVAGSTQWEMGRDAVSNYIRDGGVNPAIFGKIRLADPGTTRVIIGSRNLGNTGNIGLLSVRNDDFLFLGSDVSTNRTAALVIDVNNAVLVNLSGTTRWRINTASLQYDDVASALTIFHTSRISNAATNRMTIRAQSAFASATGTNRDAADIYLGGGAPSNTNGVRKGVSIGIDGTTFAPIFQVTEVQAAATAASRVISLHLNSAITTTQMPTNTGDLVTYIGNRSVAPTANPSGGGIQYVEGGQGVWRSSNGFTTIFGV